MATNGLLLLLKLDYFTFAQTPLEMAMSASDCSSYDTTVLFQKKS